VTGVGEDLIAEFSTRARDLDAATAPLIDEYVAKHGRQPSKTTIVKLRQEATLTTRPDKQVDSSEPFGWDCHHQVAPHERQREQRRTWRFATAVLPDLSSGRESCSGADGGAGSAHPSAVPLAAIGYVVTASPGETWRHS